MDPIFTQLNKAALEKAVPSSSTPGSSASSFQKTLDLQGTQSEDMTSKLMSMVDNTFGVNSGVREVDASSVKIEISKISEVEKKPGSNQFFDLLQDVNKDQLQFENLKEMFSSGRTYRPQELIAAQIATQHLSLQLELFSKGLEQLNRTIQTPINMQIG